MALFLAGMPSSAADAGSAGADWPSHNGAGDADNYSTLDLINTSTIDRLGLAWSLDLPGEQSLEATPIEIDGVLYFTGSYSAVYAVDAATGKLLWRYDPEIWRHDKKLHLIFPINRGAAFADGRVFSATLDGRLLALDAKTGNLLWSVETVPADVPYTVTGAPCVFKGKVIIGNGGSDFGARGYVTAYDAATGKQVWRFYTTPGSPEQNRGDPAMERAAATWNGAFWKIGTGGTPWDGFTFDAELNRVYVGTGNAGPYNDNLRSPGGGDNLYTASIVALDADTGKYVWHYQVNPRDVWDFDSTQQMALADLVIDGKRHKVLMQAPKNGFFYVLDRENGKLLSAGKVGKATWADHIDIRTGRPVEVPNSHYDTGDMILWPGMLGNHSWQAMSFSPKTGLVYIPTMQLGVRFSKTTHGDDAFGGVVVNALKGDPQDGKGTLLAWDPAQEKSRWSIPLEKMWNGGTLATAGNLVFQGTADGYLSAYEASTGKRLWHFYAGLGIISPPISYSIGEKQYISILVGFGGNAYGTEYIKAGWKFGAQPRRLLTFALDATGKLPPTAPRDLTLKPVDDPSYKLDKALLPEGANLATFKCGLCHGYNLVSAGVPAPDLRKSRVALDRDALWSVLHDGTLREQGMPQFEALTPKQVGALYAYIRAAAREALETPKPPEEPAGPHQ